MASHPCLLVVLYIHVCVVSKRKRIPEGQSKMDNPEKLATLVTQDEEKQKHVYVHMLYY